MPKDGYTNRRTLGQIVEFVVHHTGVGPARPTMAEIAAYQTGPTAQLPFPGYAYWGGIDADGTFSVAYDLEVVEWSQGDGSPTDINGVGIYNYQGVAVEISGENPTPAQIATLHRVHQVLADPSVLARTLVVRGHRAVSGRNDTECPGDAMMAVIAANQI